MATDGAHATTCSTGTGAAVAAPASALVVDDDEEEQEQAAAEEGTAAMTTTTTMNGNGGGDVDADAAPPSSSPAAAAAPPPPPEEQQTCTGVTSIVRPSTSDDAAEARMAELAAIAAVTGMGADDDDDSSSADGEDADPWSADLTSDGIPPPPQPTSPTSGTAPTGTTNSNTGPGAVLNRLSSLRATVTQTAQTAKTTVMSNPTVKQAQSRGWRANAAGLGGSLSGVASSLAASTHTRGADLVKTVSGVGVGRSDDEESSSSGEGEESGSSSGDSPDSGSGSTSVGDEEDEYTSGPEGIRYSESEEMVQKQQQQDEGLADDAIGGEGVAAATAAGAAAAATAAVIKEGQSSNDDADANANQSGAVAMTEMEIIEEELPMATATPTSAASARWFTARRTALDSVATGFRGRYNDKAPPPAPAPAEQQQQQQQQAKESSSSSLSAAVATSTGGAAATTTAAVTPTDNVRAMDLNVVSIMPPPPPPPPPVGGIASPPQASPPKPTTKVSSDPHADQVHRILSFGPEMDALISTLKPDQYPMLLGRGMLGVNLRQTYGNDQNGGANAGLGSCGVYVDYVVPRGNADKSGVVKVGDRLVKVGDDNVTRGTIGDIPRRIAETKRPAVLVLAAGKELGQDGEGMDWVDASIGLINALAGDVTESQLVPPKLEEVEEKEEQKLVVGEPSPAEPLEREVSLLDADGDDDDDNEDNNDGENEVEGVDKEGCKDTETPAVEDEEEVETQEGGPSDTLTTPQGKNSTSDTTNDDGSPYNLVPTVDVTTPSYPSPSTCKELVKLATRRANPTGSISSGTINSLFEDLEMIENGDDEGAEGELSKEIATAKRMKEAFHKALVAICLDPRCNSFLTTHLEIEDKKAVEARKQAVKEMGLPPSDVDEELDRRNSAAVLIKYYLELLSYLVVMEAVPNGRRTEFEMRLADAFRDLTASNLLTDRDTLAEIKATLDEMLVKGSAKSADKDLLDKLRILTGQSIAVSPQFVTFLLGSQCARMRAYLHRTAPFVSIPLIPVVDGAIDMRRGQAPSITAAHAHNHLLFEMLHLICRYEIDEESQEAQQGFPVPEKDRKRISGSAGGLSCALYIRGTMLRCIEEATAMLQRRHTAAEGEDQSKEEEDACYHSLISSCEQLWEAYVAPAGGILDEIIPDDSERIVCLINDVRRALVGAISVGDRPRGDRGKVALGDDLGLKVVRAVVSTTELKVSLEKLAEELVHEYAVTVRPDFRKHMFHEWMCGEVQRWATKQAKSAAAKESTDETLSRGIYPMSEGSITRLMRRVELPDGVSQHRPQRIASELPLPTSKLGDETAAAGQQPRLTKNNVNAEYAIVFGNDEGMDSTGRVLDPSLAVDFGAVRRFACVKLRGQADEPSLDEDDIPPTLENYAVTPPIRELPFADIIDEGRLSTDGWEVSLINFMVPNTNPSAAESMDDAGGQFIYGVSLVFNQIVEEGVDPEGDDDDQAPTSKYITELEYTGDSSETSPTPSKDGNNEAFTTPAKESNQQVTFQSPITISRSKRDDGSETNEIVRKIRVSAQTPEFNRRLREMRWSERVKKRKTSGGGGATVGIALVSGRNSIPAMRNSLSQLFDDYTNVGLDEDGAFAELSGGNVERVCDLLVDILGTLSQINVEKEALNCILEPYIEYGSSQWISRPLSDQRKEFASTSGLELIQSLPPIPLALLFVTILLEQKIVVSSRRRSVLVSATTALRSLLNPLTWAHLFVPLVPASMAGDLIHYPAPFIMGVPSEDEDSMVLLNSLPDDVTLVDLDVGRVILARRLANEEGMNSGMLRSQVLFLAETLGSVFGCKMQGPTWRCDSPLRPFSQGGQEQGRSFPALCDGSHATNGGYEFTAVKKICKEFIVELLCGARSCCYWIEEKHPNGVIADAHECSVLFDEDRFFAIKSLRSEERYMPLLMGQQLFNGGLSDCLDGPIGRDTILALNPDDFDLVLEAFLRCQGMSTYVSSRRRETMAFW